MYKERVSETDRKIQDRTKNMQSEEVTETMADKESRGER